jgi:cell division ftsK/spoIIIE
VVAVLDSTSDVDLLRDLLDEDPTNTIVVVDDYDVLGKDHSLGKELDDYMRSCRDFDGGVLMACNLDEAQSLGRNLLASVRKNRTGLLLAPRSAADGSTFSTTLPRSVGAPVPLGRAIMITTQGWTWVQVPHATAPARAGHASHGDTTR